VRYAWVRRWRDAKTVGVRARVDSLGVAMTQFVIGAVARRSNQVLPIKSYTFRNTLHFLSASQLVLHSTKCFVAWRGEGADDAVYFEGCRICNLVPDAK
jgi:hypothetical protein